MIPRPARFLRFIRHRCTSREHFYDRLTVSPAANLPRIPLLRSSSRSSAARRRRTAPPAPVRISFRWIYKLLYISMSQRNLLSLPAPLVALLNLTLPPFRSCALYSWSVRKLLLEHDKDYTGRKVTSAYLVDVYLTAGETPRRGGGAGRGEGASEDAPSLLSWPPLAAAPFPSSRKPPPTVVIAWNRHIDGAKAPPASTSRASYSGIPNGSALSPGELELRGRERLTRQIAPSCEGRREQIRIAVARGEYFLVNYLSKLAICKINELLNSAPRLSSSPRRRNMLRSHAAFFLRPRIPIFISAPDNNLHTSQICAGKCLFRRKKPCESISAAVVCMTIY
jgi:hypothetical protein